MRLGRSRPAASYIIIKRMIAYQPARAPVSQNLFVTFAAAQHPRRRGWHMTSLPMPPPFSGPTRRRWVWVS